MKFVLLVLALLCSLGNAVLNGKPLEPVIFYAPLADAKEKGQTHIALSKALGEAREQKRPLQIATGEYRFKGAALKIHSGVTIEGAGTGSTQLVLGDDAGHNLLEVVGAENVTIRGIHFDGNRGKQKGGERYSIFIQNSRGVVIEDCVFENGVHLRVAGSSSNVVIRNNRFSGGKYALATQGGSAEQPVTDVQFIGNYVENTQNEGVDINHHTVRALIADNLFFNCHVSRDGKETRNEVIDIGGGRCEDILVTDNVIDCNGQAVQGIYVKLGSERVIISGNVIRRCGVEPSGGGAIQVSNSHEVLISENVIDGALRGILVANATLTHPCRNLSIQNNIVRGVAIHGILINPGGVDGLHIQNNQLFGGERASGVGILLRECAHFLVTGNSVRGFQGAQIEVNSSCRRGLVAQNVLTAGSEGKTLSVGGKETVQRDNLIYER